jgi:hypothetical protein
LAKGVAWIVAMRNTSKDLVRMSKERKKLQIFIGI